MCMVDGMAEMGIFSPSSLVKSSYSSKIQTLATCLTAALPREVEYMIIEHIRDKRTLSCCSLVCRAWLRVSRACLFHTITLRVPDQADVRLLAFARFLGGSAHPGSYAAKYVRDLTILGDKSFRPRSVNTDLEVDARLPMDAAHDPSLRLSTSFDSSSYASSSRSHELSSDEDSDSGYSSFLSDDHALSSDSALCDASRSCPVLYRCAKTDLAAAEDDMGDGDSGSDADTASEDGVDSDEDAGVTSEDHVDLSVHSLHAVLSCLPSLVTLSLDNLSFFDGSATFGNLAAPKTINGRTIERLYIEDCSSRGLDVRHFFAVLALFSEVQVLCVDGGPWLFYAPCKTTRLPIVRGLVLGALEESDCAIALYDYLRSSGSLDGPLKSIRFTGFTREDVEAFFHFAKDAGPYLIDLELDIFYAINDSPGLPESWESLALDFCSRLETLTFSFDFEDDEQPAWVCLEVVRNSLRLYTHLLSSRSVQRTLRIVTFQVFRASAGPCHFRRSAESSSVPLWAELDNVLADLPELSYVKFILGDVDGRGTEVQETKAGMEAFLQQYMPRMCGSGRVRMSLEEEELGEMFQY